MKMHDLELGDEVEKPLTQCEPTKRIIPEPVLNWWYESKYGYRLWDKVKYTFVKRPECNSVKHAKRELVAAGYNLDDKEEGPNKWIVENILELLEVFSKQGHSGFRAPYCISAFSKLANFEPLCPLTGEDSEWNEVGPDLWQNNRCSHVFKDSKEGPAYDGEGYIFRDQNGSCFGSSYSRKLIEFPYVPKSVYVDVVQTETNREGTELQPGSGWWETEYPDWIKEENEKLKIAQTIKGEL
jgi:hypothetical protein